MDTPKVSETSREEQQQQQKPAVEERSNHHSGYSSDPRGSHSNNNAADNNPSSRPSSSPSVTQPSQVSIPPSGTDRPRQAVQPAKNSVVIKVGMVGDAQIGKTSLMVKYVEGSWDEDYIQTLGKPEL